MDEAPGPAARHSAWWAVLHLRCPACREGRVFSGQFAMNDECPVCGLRFMREPGYFTGAMYISYALGIPIVALLTLVAYLAFPTWRLYQLVLLAWVGLLPLVPAVYHYSRVLWIYFDRYFDPE